MSTDAELLERITVRAGVFGGKPVIRGMRIAVEHVLAMLAAGDTPETILREYPFWSPRTSGPACCSPIAPSPVNRCTIARRSSGELIAGGGGGELPGSRKRSRIGKSEEETHGGRALDAEIPWRINRADGDHWVGICDAPALTVESETWAELMEDIALTLDAMFQDLLAGDELDPFLRDRGWTAHVPAEAEAVRFDVPFIPALVQPDDSTAAVQR